MGKSHSRLRILLLGASGTGKTEFLNNLCHDGPGAYGGKTRGFVSGNYIHRRTPMTMTEIGGDIGPLAWGYLVKKDSYDCIYFFVNLEWSKLELLEQKNALFLACAYHPRTPLCVIARWRMDSNTRQLEYGQVIELMQLEDIGQSRSVWYIQMSHYGILAVQGVELLLDWTIRTCQVQPQNQLQSASPKLA